MEERGYNLRNEPIRWTDGVGNCQEMEYTLDGQVREVRRGRNFGRQENAVQSYTGQNENEQSYIGKNLAGQGSVNQSQEGNSRIGQSQQHNPIQQYEYNARGQIVGIVDGVGEKIGYDLDSWGRIISVNFSDGVKEGYEYTPSGQEKKRPSNMMKKEICNYTQIGMGTVWRRMGFNVLQEMKLSPSIPRINTIFEASC